jgi:hypothetical protein
MFIFNGGCQLKKEKKLYIIVSRLLDEQMEVQFGRSKIMG